MGFEECNGIKDIYVVLHENQNGGQNGGQNLNCIPRNPTETSKNSTSELLMLGMNLINWSSMLLLVSGVYVSKHAWKPMADISNINYSSIIFQD